MQMPFVTALYVPPMPHSLPSIFLARAPGQRREPCPSRSTVRAGSWDFMWTETRCFTASCETPREPSACLLTLQTPAPGRVRQAKELGSEGRSCTVSMDWEELQESIPTRVSFFTAF